MQNLEASNNNTAEHEINKAIPRSTLVSRNIVVSGRRTSIRLEPEMWDGLREICQRERNSLHHICTAVSVHKHRDTSLTAAIRVFVMRYYRVAATEDGHSKAGHGFGVALTGNRPSGHYAGKVVALSRTSFC